jgi:osmotically-inducible protein OsmY
MNVRKVGFGAAAGVALGFLFRDRLARVARKGAEWAERSGRAVGARVYGTSKDYDDATLARKVETEIFRPDDAPKGQVDVNVQNGVVQLRGEVESPDLSEDLAERTRQVDGVRDVENLLHVPGAEAPVGS